MTWIWILNLTTLNFPEKILFKMLSPWIPWSFIRCTQPSFLFLFYFFISWKLITLQYCSGFCHTLTWISHGYTCIPHPDPAPTSLSTRSLWVFPVHQVWTLVSCSQPGLVIHFTLDNIHDSMLFSWSIPLSPSPRVQKSVFIYLCLFFCFPYRVIINIFLNSIYMC